MAQSALTGDHPELFIGTTAEYARVVKVTTAFFPTSVTNHKPTCVIQLLHSNSYCNIFICFNTAYQTVTKTVCYISSCSRSPRYFMHATLVFAVAPIRTKCQKNVTQKCHSVIIHTYQSTAFRLEIPCYFFCRINVTKRNHRYGHVTQDLVMLVKVGTATIA